VWKTTGLRPYCFDPIDDIEYLRRINYSKEKLHKQVLHHKKLFRLRHLAHIKSYMAKWREGNRETVLAVKRDHYYRNTEKYRENAKKWEARNPDKVREHNAINAILHSLDPVQQELSVIRTYRHREAIAKAKTLGTSTPTMSHVATTRQTLKILTPEGRGKTVPLTGIRSYRTGTIVKLTAKATRPYTFKHWLIDNVLTVTTNPYLITMSVNHVVKAVFVKGYSINVTVEGPGTVTKSPDKPLYESGEVVTLTAVPGPESIAKGWTDNGVVKPAGPLVITV